MIARGLTALLCAAALSLLAAPALAGPGNVSSRLTIKLKREIGQDTIFGKVRSDAQACESGRKLKLYHRDVKRDEKSEVMLTLRANGKGKWTYRAKKNINGENYATPGYYRIKGVETKTRSGITCKDRFSSPLLIA